LTKTIFANCIEYHQQVAALATNIPNQENGVIGQAAPLSTNVLPTDFLATAQATAPSLVSGSETARQQIGAEGGEEKTNAKGIFTDQFQKYT
jgi:hypothetical protein